MEIEKTTAQILAPDGSIANKPTEVLTTEEAELLRKYKQFLQRHSYREALYCDRCWDHDLSDGCKSYVTTNQIGIICRCRMSFFQGLTY